MLSLPLNRCRENDQKCKRRSQMLHQKRPFQITNSGFPPQEVVRSCNVATRFITSVTCLMMFFFHFSARSETPVSGDKQGHKMGTVDFVTLRRVMETKVVLQYQIFHPNPTNAVKLLPRFLQGFSTDQLACVS